MNPISKARYIHMHRKLVPLHLLEGRNSTTVPSKRHVSQYTPTSLTPPCCGLLSTEWVKDHLDGGQIELGEAKCTCQRCAGFIPPLPTVNTSVCKLNHAVNRQDASFESYIESECKKTYTAPGVNGPCFSAGIQAEPSICILPPSEPQDISAANSAPFKSQPGCSSSPAASLCTY